MQIQTLIYFNLNQFKSSQFKLIQLFSILFWFVLFKQLCQYLSYFRSNFSSPPWSWVFRYKNQFISISHTCTLHTHKERFLIYQSLQHIHFHLSLFCNIFCKQKCVSKLCLCKLSICIISGWTFFCHHGLCYANTKPNLLQFSSTFPTFELFQI